LLGSQLQCTYADSIALGGAAPTLRLGLMVSAAASMSITFQATASIANDANTTNNIAANTGSVSASAVPPGRRGIQLWPPNGKLVGISLDQCVMRHASCPGPVSGTFSGASSDEPNPDGARVGADIVFPSCTQAQVRVEREGAGDGRVYRLRYDVTDHCGTHFASYCRVEVPHDQGGPAAQESPQSYAVDGPAGCHGQGG
jgi:hypothetical protein